MGVIYPVLMSISQKKKKKKVGGRGKTDIQSLIQTLKDQMFLRIAIF